MSEGGQLGIWVLKMVAVVGCAVLYRLGGWMNKVWRRYVMPLVYGVVLSGFAVYHHSWSWTILLYAVLLSLALHIGYGAEGIKDKITKRFIAGSLAGLAAIPLAITYHLYAILVFHITICTMGSIFLGVWNESKEGAAGEEATIGLLYTVLPIMMV